MSLKSADFNELASILYRSKVWMEENQQFMSPDSNVLTAFLKKFLYELNTRYFLRMDVKEMDNIIWPSTPSEKPDEVSEARIASLLMLANGE